MIGWKLRPYKVIHNWLGFIKCVLQHNTLLYNIYFFFFTTKNYYLPIIRTFQEGEWSAVCPMVFSSKMKKENNTRGKATIRSFTPKHLVFVRIFGMRDTGDHQFPKQFLDNLHFSNRFSKWTKSPNTIPYGVFNQNPIVDTTLSFVCLSFSDYFL